MISLKELKYVGLSADKVPFPGEEYAKETLETMLDSFCKYEEKYKDKNYSIVFSDSSELNFEVMDINVCHMLGVDHQSFFNSDYNDFVKKVLGYNLGSDKLTSYCLIDKILENKDKVLEYDIENETHPINYYKARIKCAIFDKMSDFEKFNFIKLGTSDATKILFTQSNEVNCPYFFIRLALLNNSFKYCVNSLMALESNKIANYFKYDASIPTQILIDNNKNLTKIEATPREKIDLLNMYKKLILEHTLNDKMNITGDYMSLLSSMDVKQKVKRI